MGVMNLLKSGFMAWVALGQPAGARDEKGAQARAVDFRPEEWPYTPISMVCPEDTTFIRSADGIGLDEKRYREGRLLKAKEAVRSWASRFVDVKNTTMPTLGLVVSGGNFRSMLVGGGIIKAMDNREDHAGHSDNLSGLWQGLTYQVGTSGGGWLIGSILSHQYGPSHTISSVAETWRRNMEDSYLALDLPSDPDTSGKHLKVVEELLADLNHKAKWAPVSEVDAMARLLGLTLMPDRDDASKNLVRTLTLSAVREFAPFRRREVPIPILTALNVDRVVREECFPGQSAPHFEFSPFEFGSFGTMPSAFSPTYWLGSRLTYSTASSEWDCTRNYDNLAFLLATIANTQNYKCNLEKSPVRIPDAVLTMLETEWRGRPGTAKGSSGYFGLIPNAFRKYRSTTSDDFSTTDPYYQVNPLHFVSGTQANHGLPILPLLEPSRGVDVIFVSDNTADIDKVWLPNGDQLVAEKLRADEMARVEGRFPQIPDMEQFNLDGKALVFGCDEPDAATIVYLPNHQWTEMYRGMPANDVVKFGSDELKQIIENGVQVATQGGDREWGFCLACIVMKKQPGFNPPDLCNVCYERHCFKPEE